MMDSSTHSIITTVLSQMLIIVVLLHQWTLYLLSHYNIIDQLFQQFIISKLLIECLAYSNLAAPHSVVSEQIFLQNFLPFPTQDQAGFF